MCLQKIKDRLEEMGTSLENIVHMIFYVAGPFPDGVAKSPNCRFDVLDAFFKENCPTLCMDNNPPSSDLIGVAALGAVGAFAVAAIYKRFSWNLVKKCALGTVRTAAVVLIIIATAQTFSQMLAFSGATQQITTWVLSLNLSPTGAILIMMGILLFLGCFLDTVGMIMITIPIFMPIVKQMGIDPVWFGMLILINMQLDGLTPPVGMMLYVVKGVAPPGTTMSDVIKAAVPFVICDIIAILIILVFPQIALFLPNLMRGGG